MNIIKQLNQFNIDSVYFCDPIKNNIVSDGTFVRIIYSNKLFMLNGIYLLIPFQNLIIEKYYNKFRCNYDINLHKELIEKIKCIEEHILHKNKIKDKIPICKIYEHIKNGNIKIFSDDIDKIKNIFILKISGIWETAINYGVTYKFININNIDSQ
jgi:hypothetical protein